MNFILNDSNNVKHKKGYFSTNLNRWRHIKILDDTNSIYANKISIFTSYHLKGNDDLNSLKIYLLPSLLTPSFIPVR